MIVVKFFFSFKEIIGKNEISSKAKSLSGLLQELICRYPKLKDGIFDGEKVREGVVILVNGRAEKELQTKLGKGDIVAIFSQISGG